MNNVIELNSVRPVTILRSGLEWAGKQRRAGEVLTVPAAVADAWLRAGAADYAEESAT